MDERFFLFCEEPDLCLRMKQAGWQIRHLPSLTVLHHGHGERWHEKLLAQEAYSRRLYMQKHFSAPRRLVGTGALALGYGARAALIGRDRGLTRRRHSAALRALRTLVGSAPPPFGEPPHQAVSRRD
jgi:GT2 family glycosyltransferase